MNEKKTTNNSHWQFGFGFETFERNNLGDWLLAEGKSENGREWIKLMAEEKTLAMEVETEEDDNDDDNGNKKPHDG